MSKYFTIEDIVGVLQLHDPCCVFELDAPKNIVERLSKRTKNEWLPWLGLLPEKRNDEQKSLHEEFKMCWQLSEIYCPHEGIDRRSEYGIGV